MCWCSVLGDCSSSGWSATWSSISTVGSSYSALISKTIARVSLLVSGFTFFSIGLLSELTDCVITREIPLPRATLTRLKDIGFHVSKREFDNAPPTGTYTRTNIEDWLIGKRESQVLKVIRNFSLLSGSVLFAVERHFAAEILSENSAEFILIMGANVMAAIFFVDHLRGVYKCNKHPGLPAIIAAGAPVENNETSVSISPI